MKDLGKIFFECKAELQALGIKCGNVRSVTVNTRAKSRWGQCKRISDNLFEINISAVLLRDEIDVQTIKNTVMHELLHTVSGCFEHRGKWKLLAQYVNTKLPQYNIKRVTSYEEIGIERGDKNPQFSYVLRCLGCGQEVCRQKKSKVITNYSRYRCIKCGGKFERIK